MTIDLWVTTGIVFILGIIACFIVCGNSEGSKPTIITAIISLIIVIAMILGGHWWCNNTASGTRALKDQKSELSNGLNREIIITAEDGREIFYYNGKCDIETNDNYILFETEEGLRQMIYFGITDTVIVSEY